MHPLDLRDHARDLIDPRLNPPGRPPVETKLRRAISASYYALFHTLTAAGAEVIAPANPVLQSQVARAFAHSSMRKVCDAYVRSPGQPFPPALAQLNPGTPNSRLVNVVTTFASLQEARHLADYDLMSRVDYPSTVRPVGAADSAISNFTAIQTLPETQVFLIALLLADRWTRRG